MDIVNNPNFTGIPKSRQGLKNAKDRVAQTLKIPMLQGKKVEWEENGVKFTSREGLSLLSDTDTSGFINVIEWVEYCYGIPEWSQLMQCWTTRISNDGHAYEIWDSSLFWKSTVQGESHHTI